MVRLIEVFEKFLSNVKISANNITMIESNFELEVRRITWLDHESGAEYLPSVSIYYCYFWLHALNIGRRRKWAELMGLQSYNQALRVRFQYQRYCWLTSRPSYHPIDRLNSSWLIRIICKKKLMSTSFFRIFVLLECLYIRVEVWWSVLEFQTYKDDYFEDGGNWRSALI